MTERSGASREGRGAHRRPPSTDAGRASPAAAVAAVASLVLGGCIYGFSGGGGLPAHIETLAVPPVENQTTQVTLTDRLFEALLDMAQGRLGAQLASENQADAIVRAAITGYDDRALSFQAQEGRGANVFQRQVTIRASVEIYDASRDGLLWSSRSLTGIGEYAPEEESEDVGRALAIRNLIDKIVNGAQSQW